MCVCVCVVSKRKLEEKIKSSTYFAFSDLSSFVPDVLFSKYLIPTAVAIAPRTIYINVPHANAEPSFTVILYLCARDETCLNETFVIRDICTEILFILFFSIYDQEFVNYILQIF